VADDLGYNDISTFGGGVANGKVKTPHIDQLAAEGAIFTQSYSGAGTCAPSRAMLMTGRYPTRTGFEFTPTPSGMTPIVSMVRESIPSNLPASRYQAELDESKPPYEESPKFFATLTTRRFILASGISVGVTAWLLMSRVLIKAC